MNAVERKSIKKVGAVLKNTKVMSRPFNYCEKDPIPNILNNWG